MNILAIGANPGEIEFSCFGTLALCREKGDKVVICSMTNGLKTKDDENLRLIKMVEGSRAAKIIGASYSTFDINQDEFLNFDKEHLDKLINLILATKADVVISLDPEKPNRSQHLTASLVKEAIERVKVDEDRLVELLFGEAVDAKSFNPTLFVDVSSVFNQKIEAVTTFVSQIQFLHKSDKLNLLHNVEVIASYRGLQCASRYAEAFRVDGNKALKGLF